MFMMPCVLTVHLGSVMFALKCILSFLKAKIEKKLNISTPTLCMSMLFVILQVAFLFNFVVTEIIFYNI